MEVQSSYLPLSSSAAYALLRRCCPRGRRVQSIRPSAGVWAESQPEWPDGSRPRSIVIELRKYVSNYIKDDPIARKIHQFVGRRYIPLFDFPFAVRTECPQRLLK